ncbi:Cytochrome c oxidase subunit CcoN [Moraxella catarrhalis]|nr:Cytochrome c oxidase subunit CcoN [Moraxella catarrhalis]
MLYSNCCIMAYNCYRTIKMPSVPEHIAEPEEVNTGSEQATAQA